MRAPRWLTVLILLGAVVLSACQATGQVGGNMDDDANRMIVVAVQNVPVAPLRAGSTQRAYGPGQYAVSASAQGDLQALSRDYDLQVLSQWPIELLEMHCAVFVIPTSANRDALLARLQTDKRVQLAQPLHTFETQSTPGADPYAAMQTGMQQMQLQAAHEQSQGRGVRVAVIDTGMDSTHPDLAGRVVAEFNVVDNNTAQFHQDRHGTAVAGVLAANKDNGIGMVGVAPQARLMSIKACWEVAASGDEARCNSYTLAQAIAKAVAEHAQIINLSLTGPSDVLLSALTERAIAKGIVVVGAGSSSVTPGFPGNVLRVITAMSDQNKQTTMLHAPGEEVLTLAPGGRYDFSSGDSLATAAISGVAALLVAKQRDLSSERLMQLLVNASEDRLRTNAAPVVNACRAIASLTGVDNCAPPEMR
jgi:subtilisin family serine protease